MSKFNRGKLRVTKLGSGTLVRSSNDISTTAETRIGKQSKIGPKKGMSTPGRHFNTRKLGG